MCVSTNCANQMFLYRMSYSAVLFTVRSSSVCQDVGSTNSMVICMFPWYILGWLSNLKPLTRTGKSCNGTCGMKSICFIVKTWCTETICINCRPTPWLIHSLVSHALVVPLAGPGGAAPVLIRNAVRQSTSGYKPGLLPILCSSLTHAPLFIHWQWQEWLLVG